MQFLERTSGCGLVDHAMLGKTICLAGWVAKRRDHGGLIFIDLRDRSGIMQLVFNPELNSQVHAQAHNVRSEYVICVQGVVIKRLEQTVNKELATGALELQVEALQVLNVARVLPFSVEDAQVIDEELRLKYR